MQKLKVLNSKEKKEIIRAIESRFGEFNVEGLIFFINPERKVYVMSSAYASIDISRLNVNNYGLYIGKEEVDGFRLSIEGAQLANPEKNVIEVSKDQVSSWMRGESIEVESDLDNGYVVLKSGKDIIGCGKLKGSTVLNSVPKERRIIGIINKENPGIRTIRQS